MRLGRLFLNSSSLLAGADPGRRGGQQRGVVAPAGRAQAASRSSATGPGQRAAGGDDGVGRRRVLGHGGVPAAGVVADWPRERLPLLLYVVDGGATNLRPRGACGGRRRCPPAGPLADPRRRPAR